MTPTDRNPSHLSDSQLLALHRQSGTNEYLGQLYARHIELVYGVSLKYLRDMEDAADAVMSIFEELAAKIGRYEIGDFRPWLYMVTKNYCLQKLRRKGREIPVDFSDRIVENAAFEHLLSEENDESTLAALEKCLEKLPERQRECIDLFFFNNRSYADIVAATRYQLKSVKSYIQNGKRNLKICMEKGGAHEAD